jgi:hypothetical protein
MVAIDTVVGLLYISLARWTLSIDNNSVLLGLYLSYAALAHRRERRVRESEREKQERQIEREQRSERERDYRVFGVDVTCSFLTRHDRAFPLGKISVTFTNIHVGYSNFLYSFTHNTPTDFLIVFRLHMQE